MTDIKAAYELAGGLRRLADMVQANPALIEIPGFQFAFNRMLISVNTRDEVVALTRAGMQSGATIDKHQGDKWAGTDLTFGPQVSLHVYTDREQVCTKVVTGTREVTEEVPDPELLAAVPTVTVTKVVEDVTWQCLPLLASTEDAEVAA